MWLKIVFKVASTCAVWINIYLNQHWQWFIPRSSGRGGHSSLDDSSNLISIKSLTFLVSLGKCCLSTTTQVSNIFSNWGAFTHNYTHTNSRTHSSTLRAFTSLSAIRDSHEGTPLDKVWRGRGRGDSLRQADELCQVTSCNRNQSVAVDAAATSRMDVQHAACNMQQTKHINVYTHLSVVSTVSAATNRCKSQGAAVETTDTDHKS